ncbi:acyl-CoA thioesterase [Vagococcus vulneris]|uniref:Acyl-CoA thioesterase n=1 Tax=Vagococcus vulneris TaxID=1977869 RepID=A0A430A0I2_9ENTE|nr:acyl-CoA thioesterase [Vagococcus vulneris]RST99832.1 acyl-CoA thioesterase [Vagococcus vulneris]
MTSHTFNQKKCRESRVIQTHRIFPADLNSFGALYGGKLMYFIDDSASVSASRHARQHVMTASTDSLDFLHPLLENHSVCIESYVTGTGTKSMEVFVKVIGEDLTNGKRYLAATCFMTFVVVKPTNSFTTVPEVIPETTEEVEITRGYKERRAQRLALLQENKQFANHISLTIPWVID